jgi:hypothetical protein
MSARRCGAVSRPSEASSTTRRAAEINAAPPERLTKAREAAGSPSMTSRPAAKATPGARATDPRGEVVAPTPSGAALRELPAAVSEGVLVVVVAVVVFVAVVAVLVDAVLFDAAVPLARVTLVPRGVMRTIMGSGATGDETHEGVCDCARRRNEAFTRSRGGESDAWRRAGAGWWVASRLAGR